MRNKGFFSAAMAILALLAGSSPDLVGNAQPQRSPAEPSQTKPGQQQDVKTFLGTITKSGDKWILEDASKKVTYQLDDQEKAKQYEGRSVKITGSFDVATNTIRVAKIEAAP